MDLRLTSNAAASPKDRNPLRAGPDWPPGFVAPRSQSAAAMLPRRAGPASQSGPARTTPICEMGSDSRMAPRQGACPGATPGNRTILV